MPNTGLVPASQIRDLLSAKKQALQNFLGDEKNALRFMSSVSHCLTQNPKLLDCTPDSLLGAFMECAAVGLFPSVSGGECFVIPYNSVAQFQLGYKGIRTLAYRAGVLALSMEVVYSNDYFEEELGTNPRLVHKKPPMGQDRGDPIGAYARATLSENNTVFKVMDRAQIMKIKKMSKAANSSNSPWNTNDPMLTMWGKTAFKQLAKMMPTTPELERAIYADNVCERGGHFKGEGELIEIPFDEKVGDENVLNEVVAMIAGIKTEAEYSKVMGQVSLRSGKLDDAQQNEVRELAKKKQAEIKGKRKPAAPKKELGAGEKAFAKMTRAENLNPGQDPGIGEELVNPDTGEITKKTTAEIAEGLFNPED